MRCVPLLLRAGGGRGLERELRYTARFNRQAGTLLPQG
jgi:hypothetical protein